MTGGREALWTDIPSTPWWDSPIVQQWIREGSVIAPIYLADLLPSEEDE